MAKTPLIELFNGNLSHFSTIGSFRTTYGPLSFISFWPVLYGRNSKIDQILYTEYKTLARSLVNEGMIVLRDDHVCFLFVPFVVANLTGIEMEKFFPGEA